MILTTSSYTPLHHQIKRIIIDRIQGGLYKANEKLPTEDEFCNEFGVSKAPVRQALKALASEGYIYTIRGKGSYVLSGYVKYNASRLLSFSDEIRELGYEPGSVYIGQDIIQADSETSTNLCIDEKSPVLCAVRLRTIDGEIYSLNYSFYSVERFPEVKDIDFSAPSITKEYMRVLSAETTFATVVVEATAATPELSRYLERPVGSPLLLTSRTTYCRIRHEELPFEFVRVYFVPDKYKFEINLSRK